MHQKQQTLIKLPIIHIFLNCATLLERLMDTIRQRHGIRPCFLGSDNGPTTGLSYQCFEILILSELLV